MKRSKITLILGMALIFGWSSTIFANYYVQVKNNYDDLYVNCTMSNKEGDFDSFKAIPPGGYSNKLVHKQHHDRVTNTLSCFVTDKNGANLGQCPDVPFEVIKADGKFTVEIQTGRDNVISSKKCSVSAQDGVPESIYVWGGEN